MLFNSIKKHDKHIIALRDETREVSYGDLEFEIQKRMDCLRDVSVLAIALDNSVDWVLWDLAALKSDIPCVPIPPFFTSEQVSHLLQSADVSHILSPQGLRGTGMESRIKLPVGTAKVTFTSGTTGNPKGVCLSRAAMENVAKSIVNVLGSEFVGTHMCVLPLAVLLENVAGVYAALMAGCTIELPNLKAFGKNYENIHAISKATNPTSAILVPEILRSLLGQIAVKGPLENLKFLAVGGSKVDPTLIHQAHKMGLPVYEGYGLSECASVIALNTPHNNMLGTVGKLLPHVEAYVLNDEILIKNAGFLGYVGETSSILFSTGDLGSIDENGFLTVTGRKKNLIITSYGRNISPEWVEAKLLTQSSIMQAIVYGDASPHLSALIVSLSSTADIQKSINAANQDLPDYAKIQEFQLVPPFTQEAGMLTGTGRPRRDTILNYYIKESTHELLQSIG